MPTPFDAAYWQDEENEMYEELLPLFLAALMAGMDGGIEALPPNIQPLVNPVRFNEAASRFAREYRYGNIHNITETTRAQTQAIMAEWVRSGSSLDALETQLTGIFGAARASQIAATEVTRIFAEGNAQAWITTGFVNSVRFNTAEDDRVCPLCSPLDGQIFDVDDYGYKPPIHINCRCFNTPVVDLEAVGQQLDEILGL